MAPPTISISDGGKTKLALRFDRTDGILKYYKEFGVIVCVFIGPPNTQLKVRLLDNARREICSGGTVLMITTLSANGVPITSKEPLQTDANGKCNFNCLITKGCQAYESIFFMLSVTWTTLNKTDTNSVLSSPFVSGSKGPSEPAEPKNRYRPQFICDTSYNVFKTDNIFTTIHITQTDKLHITQFLIHEKELHTYYEKNSPNLIITTAAAIYYRAKTRSQSHRNDILAELSVREIDEKVQAKCETFAIQVAQYIGRFYQKQTLTAADCMVLETEGIKYFQNCFQTQLRHEMSVGGGALNIAATTRKNQTTRPNNIHQSSSATSLTSMNATATTATAGTGTGMHKQGVQGVRGSTVKSNNSKVTSSGLSTHGTLLQKREAESYKFDNKADNHISHKSTNYAYNDDEAGNFQENELDEVESEENYFDCTNDVEFGYDADDLMNGGGDSRKRARNVTWQNKQVCNLTTLCETASRTSTLGSTGDILMRLGTDDSIFNGLLFREGSLGNEFGISNGDSNENIRKESPQSTSEEEVDIITSSQLSCMSNSTVHPTAGLPWNGLFSRIGSINSQTGGCTQQSQYYDDDYTAVNANSGGIGINPQELRDKLDKLKRGDSITTAAVMMLSGSTGLSTTTSRTNTRSSAHKHNQPEVHTETTAPHTITTEGMGMAVNKDVEVGNGSVGHELVRVDTLLTDTLTTDWMRANTQEN